MTDCLIVGFNDVDFPAYVETVRSQGERSGAYRGLNLAFVNYRGRPYRSMDLLNHFHAQRTNGRPRPFSNADFLWPVIAYLGSYLHRRGFSFDYVNLFHWEKERLREKLQQGGVRTVAITTTLYVSVEPILEVIEFVRRFAPAAKVIVGGPYVHNQARTLDDEALQLLFRYIAADVYVIGPEGEAALAEVLTALRKGSDLAQVRNIAVRDGSGFVRTRTVPEVNSLEDDMVDYTLFGREAIGEFVTLRTAKSCPFSCSFCAFPQRAGKYTYLAVDLVEKELNAIRDLGSVTTLTFIDDTFNVPKPRFKEILRMMIRNRYGFHWNSFLRSDHVDDEALDLMAESGCEGVFLGAESGSDKILKNMNKASRREDYARVIPQLRARGISTHANFIIGFPGETYETVRESVSLIEEARPDFFRTQLWYADATTPIWGRRQEFGIQGGSFNWRHDTMDAPTAAALMEQCFLSVENSMWLPEWGFDQWSVFYLQRRGMSFEGVKAFIARFNEAVREKLVFPGRSEASAELIARLEEVCRFDGERPGIAAAAVGGVGRYNAAEEYWTREFAGARESGSLAAVEDARADGREGWDSVVGEVAADSIDVGVDGSRGVERRVLAAFAVLLARWAGREEVAIVTARPGGASGAVPLRISTPWSKSFRDVVDEVAVQEDHAAEHGEYAFHVLRKDVRLAGAGPGGPVLNAGFWFHRPGPWRGDLQQALAECPEVARTLTLVLEATPGPEGLELRLVYDRSAFRAETVERVSHYLTDILHCVRRAPEMAIGDVGNTRADGRASLHETEEEFRF